MRGPFQRLMFFGRTLMAVWLLLGVGSSLLFAEDDRFVDLGRGQWIQEFRLPDTYLPAGFRRNPTNRHWIIKPMDPAGVGKTHTHQYGIMSTAYVSNKRLSAKPGDVDCPMGHDPRPFVQRIFGGVLGFWEQVFESPTTFQFNFIFEIDSCVVGMYFDVSEATPVSGQGNKRYPRPTQQEIDIVVRRFVEAYRRYITDKGWTNLKGKPPTVLSNRPDAGGVQSGGKDSVSEGSAGDDQKGTVDDGDQRQTAPVTPGEAAAGAGVVGAIAAVGAWLTMLSSGVRPKDVMYALGGLFGMGSLPEPTPVPPVAEPPVAEPLAEPLAKPPRQDGELTEANIDRINEETMPRPDGIVQETFDKAAYDKRIVDENLKQLQDDVNRAKDALERRQQYIETLRRAGRTEQASREATTLGELQREVSRTQKQLSDSGGQEAGHITKKHTFDIGEDQAAKVKEEMAAEKAGVLSDLERVKLDDWIDLQAPDEQAAKRMRAMVGNRTITLENGKTVGSLEGISRELGQMLQESNQPDLSYVERFSIRDEFMEKAIIFKSARGYGQDTVGTVSKLGKLGVIENADIKGIAKKLNPLAKFSKFLGYAEGYTKGAGNSVGYAVVKSAVQMGVREVALKNPVIGLGNTAIKYAEKAILGRDVSPGKALETMVNVAFDAVHDVKDRAPVIFNSATGKFEMGGKILRIESPELTEPATRSMLSAVDKQLSNPNLGAADRAGLLSDRKDLLETLNELKGQQ